MLESILSHPGSGCPPELYYGYRVDGAPDGIERAKMVVGETPSEGKPSMGKSITDLSSVTCVGLDLAKKVFQVHAVDAKGEVIVGR
jgi:hypothetical protein